MALLQGELLSQTFS